MENAMTNGSTAATITRHEAEQIERANAGGRQPVVFVGDPEAVQTTCDAAADRGGWDRDLPDRKP
jgi:hypothetical protein